MRVLFTVLIKEKKDSTKFSYRQNPENQEVNIILVV